MDVVANHQSSPQIDERPMITRQTARVVSLSSKAIRVRTLIFSQQLLPIETDGFLEQTMWTVAGQW